MLHNPATTTETTLTIELAYRDYGFGALLAHLTVHSSTSIIVSQANQLLEMEHNGEDKYERDIALVRGEPLLISSEKGRMLLIYIGNKFMQISEQEGATLVVEGIGVIENG